MSHDDFQVEPIRGLPEALPVDEHILWQGRPATWRLAREALALNWVAGYFLLLAVWRMGVSSTLMPLPQAALHAVPFLVIGAVACGLLLGLAAIQARSTVYTVTNKRVAMRIGAALTLTLNLPFTQIATAKLDLRRSGHGTLAFDTLGDTRLSYFTLWPHVRPWHFSPARPALRCVPDAEKVAAIFAEAAEARVSRPQVERVIPDAIAAE